MLVFVRYAPQHIFQEEWVWNAADIDGARVVWARDLGPEENAKLLAYYPTRTALLFEPDARPMRLHAVCGVGALRRAADTTPGSPFVAIRRTPESIRGAPSAICDRCPNSSTSRLDF